MKKTEEKKQHILRSANELIKNKGIGDITLDEIAKEAGYSKGGLTHYYSNKDTLLVDLAEMINQQYLERIEENYLKKSQNAGSWTRALIEESIKDLQHNTDVNIALIAASLTKKSEISSITKSFERIQERVTTDDYDSVIGTIIRLAIDGMYYTELFDVATMSQDMKHQVIEQLVAWTREEQKNGD